MSNRGVIYILTNPSFPEYVKIGYADDMKSRLAQLNRSECTPFAFRVYATYEVDSRLTDMKIHDIIDKLNPNLRAIDNVEGKKRVREFYAMSAEDAYELFEAMAEIHGTTSKLKKYNLTKAQAADETAAQEIKEEARQKAKSFTFSSCDITVGETVEFFNSNNPNNGASAVVIDDKHVQYNGETWTLSSLAKELLGTTASTPGPDYFVYKGKKINDIRREKGIINF